MASNSDEDIDRAITSWISEVDGESTLKGTDLVEPSVSKVPQIERKVNESFSWLSIFRRSPPATELNELSAKPAIPVTSQPRLPEDWKEIDPSKVYPEEMSCRQQFDEYVKCHSVAAQVRHIYRYGTIRDCAERWDMLKFCFRAQFEEDDAKKVMIREYYQQKLARDLAKGSSEDVWSLMYYIFILSAKLTLLFVKALGIIFQVDYSSKTKVDSTVFAISPLQTCVEMVCLLQSPAGWTRLGNHPTSSSRNISALFVKSKITTRHNSDTTLPSTVASRHFYQNDVIMRYARRAASPVSLRQFAFFGRRLTAEKILQSANFVREELPTRLAYRLQDMQELPYSVLRNQHISKIYELYHASFNHLRRFPILRTLEDNDKFCELLQHLLLEHTGVIPNVVMSAIEVSSLMDRDQLDEFLASLLSSRISRRVLTEQHITMTNSFKKYPNSLNSSNQVGQVFLECKAADVLDQCASLARSLLSSSYDISAMPKLELEGDIYTTFAFIESHLRYMVGEILRNIFQAAALLSLQTGTAPSPLQVTICDGPQHIVFRFSDHSGGIPEEAQNDLFSFGKDIKNTDRQVLLERLQKSPMDELEGSQTHFSETSRVSSLHSLTTRPPDLKLGMGFPMSKIYAEFWGGKIAVRSMNGYGTDTFLHISKLGIESKFLEHTTI
ncbi:uncharacterized protein V1516DRAFT_662722 [Lipomyces oligophaga]|uniref:uncharacterized protein n=1 Tax=Lipomyces oligophaga TaxID=45792 RepID=UPI0034CDF151